MGLGRGSVKRGTPCQLDLAAMYQVVCKEPGITKVRLLKRFGIRGCPDSVLQAFEGSGMVLAEDSHGGLYPLDKKAWGLE